MIDELTLLIVCLNLILLLIIIALNELKTDTVVEDTEDELMKTHIKEVCIMEYADEFPDNPEDIDGKELNVGDRVSFTIAGSAADNEFEGVVTLEGETYCVQSGDNLFLIDNDLLELKLLEWDESSSPECSVCDEGE